MSAPLPEIASTANDRVKAVARLRDRRERDRTGLTVVDGAREIRRAIEAGVGVETLFTVDPPPPGDAAAALAAAGAAGVRVTSVSPAVAERLAFGGRSDGIVAVVRVPPTDLASLSLPDEPLIVVIDGVEKPGNVGAILRTADGAGADAVILTDPATDLYNPNAIRSSIGTIFSLRPVIATAREARRTLTVAGVRIVAARVDAPRFHTAADLTGPLAIVVGSEAEGLGAAWSGDDVLPVRLPMLGRADSLNVSVAAAVLLYEARRQRDARGR